MFLNALVSAGSKPLKILCGSAHPDDRDIEVSASGHGVKRRKNLLIRQVASCAKENKCIRFKILHLKPTLLAHAVATFSFSFSGSNLVASRVLRLSPVREVSFTDLNFRNRAPRPLLPASQQLLPAAQYPARQDAPRQSAYRPSHNRCRSGPASRDRRAGQYRWETPRWRLRRGVPPAVPASTPALSNDNGSRSVALSRAPSTQPHSTGDVRLCRFPPIRGHHGK